MDFLKSTLDRAMTKKIRINPAERLGLKLTQKERELLLGFDNLDRDLAERIEGTPSNQAMAEFTLEELNRLACYLTVKADYTASKAMATRLQAITGRISALEEIFFTEQQSTRKTGP